MPSNFLFWKLFPKKAILLLQILEIFDGKISFFGNFVVKKCLSNPSNFPF